jgi:hypothetical protein
LMNLIPQFWRRFGENIRFYGSFYHAFGELNVSIRKNIHVPESSQGLALRSMGVRCRCHLLDFHPVVKNSGLQMRSSAFSWVPFYRCAQGFSELRSRGRGRTARRSETTEMLSREYGNCIS